MLVSSPKLSGSAGRAPSIVDVARRAGVSSQTVSRVVTGAPYVSDKTRAAVLEAMAEVSYTPNAAARALRSGSFGTIGVIVHQLSRTGESRTVEAIVEAARAVGYTVSLVDVEQVSDLAVEAAVARLQHQLIDALVIVRNEIEVALDLHIPASMPYVVSDARAAEQHDSVGGDQRAGTFEAVHHLLDLGHRTVHHLAGPLNSAPALARQDAWQQALADAGRLVPLPVRGDWLPGSGYQAGTDLLQRRADGEDVTAVFAANDEMAVGLMRAAEERGVRIGQDLSLIGFDNIPVAAYLSPPLTTVEQDFPSIGKALVELLMEQIERRRSATEPQAQRSTRITGDAGPDDLTHDAGEAFYGRVVPARLIVRASTAPPPR